jgi:hypothetical protein
MTIAGQTEAFAGLVGFEAIANRPCFCEAIIMSCFSGEGSLLSTVRLLFRRVTLETTTEILGSKAI